MLYLYKTLSYILPKQHCTMVWILCMIIKPGIVHRRWCGMIIKPGIVHRRCCGMCNITDYYSCYYSQTTWSLTRMAPGQHVYVRMVVWPRVKQHSYRCMLFDTCSLITSVLAVAATVVATVAATVHFEVFLTAFMFLQYKKGRYNVIW